MPPKLNLRLAITLILTGPVVSVAYDARTPDCIKAHAKILTCPQQPSPPDIFFPDEPGTITLRLANSLTFSPPEPPPAEDEFPSLLRNSSANFFASEYQPRRRPWVQVDQQGRNHALLDLKPIDPPKRDPTPLPDHIETENPQIPRIGQMAGISTGTSSAFGATNAIRQIMATSAQFPAAYEETFIQPWHGNLLITTSNGSQAEQKELKKEALEPPEHPDQFEPKELFAPVPPMPAADAWDYFSDDGYDHDASAMQP